jgi:glutamate-5-semialdehyde dehydrogenase
MESILSFLEAAQIASIDARRLNNVQKIEFLNSLSNILLENTNLIIQENKKDLDRMSDEDPKKDRLLLNENRIKALAISLIDVAKLEDPTGKILYTNTTGNGLKIKKITVPIGVVGVIYEARPNVTIDVAALCVRSGNTVLLRGGSDAEYTNEVLVKMIHQALEKNNINKKYCTTLAC